MSESKRESQMLKSSTSDLKLDLRGSLKSPVNGNNLMNTNTNPNKTSNTIPSNTANIPSNTGPKAVAITSPDRTENKKATAVNPQNQVSISEITDELTNKLNEALMEINGSDKEFSRLFDNIEKRIVTLDKKV